MEHARSDENVIDSRSTQRSVRPPFPGLSEHIALALEEAILLGKLTSGERIVESEIAAEMGTSNGPVREALHELENLGLLASVPRRGTFVTRFTARLAREVFSLRAMLETTALRLVIPRLQDSDLARFDAAIEDMGRYPGGPSESPRELVDADLRFHDIFLDLSSHRLLQQDWQRLRVQARVLLVVTGALWKAEARSAAERAAGMVEVHLPLVEAIRARDPRLAERRFVEHLANGERLIINRLAPDEEGDIPLVKRASRAGLTSEGQ